MNDESGMDSVKRLRSCVNNESGMDSVKRL